ncbi:MAG TPA: 4-alpha-glucanotransferase, partial [Candidatus Baltobacteraceae bacterium]
MIETSQALEALATALGLEPTFTDAFGLQTQVSAPTKRALAAAMGYPAHTDEAVVRSLAQLARALWLRMLDPVLFACEEEPPVLVLTLHSAPEELEITWTITQEDDTEREGTVRWAAGSSLEKRVIDGRGYERRTFTLPVALPLGYHCAAFHVGPQSAQTTIIVAPQQAYVPAALETSPAWGVVLQLYALRRESDWGIGDFTALESLASVVARNGGAAVALNPLHRLHIHNPAAISPYGPTSRFALDPLYIDPLAVPDYAESPNAQTLAAEPSINLKRAALHDLPLIDYPRVSALKQRLFEALYASFREQNLRADGAPRTPRGEAFVQFRREGGLAIDRLAIYEALAEYHLTRNEKIFGWLQWPQEYRDPASPAVAAFAQKHHERVDYFVYLAWIADEQLAQAAEACASMPIGLYRDLAVGADSNSAEAWSAQDVMRTEISVGAPPDPLNTDGQSWGLPALDPGALREVAYAPFARLLRANMRYAGALRIDHVMALTRLFWIPAGRPANEGAYVHYRLDEMLAVLALESVRARCMVVGEDLGTVPPGFRERLARARLFSTRLLFFERTAAGGFVEAGDYPRYAVASVGTHDLAPLAGWWSGRDIEVRLS